mmetsp:Transcript_47725/g.137873  ORF Transcript_47725/g.137873 Transcript_47725/m.137873 type:complete len:80 (+) Transcript_47725:148-387(+)
MGQTLPLSSWTLMCPGSDLGSGALFSSVRYVAAQFFSAPLFLCLVTLPVRRIPLRRRLQQRVPQTEGDGRRCLDLEVQP